MSGENFAKRIKKITADWDEYWSYDTANDSKKIFFSRDSPTSAVNTVGSFFHNKLLWEVFVYAMAIVKYLYDKSEGEGRQPFKQTRGTIPIAYTKEEHLHAILGLVFSLKETDMSIINRPGDIRKICEEYANGGVEKLIEFEENRDASNPVLTYEKELFEFLNKSKTTED